ncbi:MAG: LLM class flavin-dependent oxidoreductase [Acidimicrobiia bacterium]|nr:LLM class flavin-dependent oxidoreductase [Acidimicrobiia bacterium]
MDDIATGVWFFPEQPAGALVDAVVHVEGHGMNEVWLGDEGPARDPFAVLAAAATATSAVTLAVGVTNPYLRHPAATATSVLTIHELSGGRAILGIGAGGQISLGPYGIEPTRPVTAIRDAIRLTRAVATNQRTEGYLPPDLAVTERDGGAPLPVYVGARGEHLNRLASNAADGAFVAGLPPFRYTEVIEWARSDRSIDIALYPSVAFTEEAIEHHRPEMIWALLDSPDVVRDRLDLDVVVLRSAAAALRGGDPEPARRLVTDDVLTQVMLVGSPNEVGASLADLVAAHQPTSIGLALLQDDLVAGIDAAAEAFTVMRAGLGIGPS